MPSTCIGCVQGKPHWTDYTPGTPLVILLRKMLELPRWRKNGGRDFVFYDSHPGFVDGEAANAFLDMNCGVLRNSIHFVSEHAQKSWCRQAFSDISTSCHCCRYFQLGARLCSENTSTSSSKSTRNPRSFHAGIPGTCDLGSLLSTSNNNQTLAENPRSVENPRSCSAGTSGTCEL